MGHLRRVSSGDAPGDRHRQLEHHDRPVPERPARRDPPGGDQPASTPDELELLIEGLLGLDTLELRGVASIACASVVPSLTAALESVAVRRDLGLVLATAGHVPLPIRVERPDEVGADRLVNALAAGRLYGTPAVVVDLGTASTFDAVAADGAFVGGAIAPGLEVGLDALAARTAKLPRIELRKPDRAIARDTVGALQAGAILGYQALVSGLLGRVRRELADTAGIDPGRDHDPDRRPGPAAVGRGDRGDRHDRSGPDPQGPLDPACRGRPAASRSRPASDERGATRDAAEGAPAGLHRARDHRLDRGLQVGRAAAPAPGRGSRGPGPADRRPPASSRPWPSRRSAAGRSRAT